MHYRRQRYGGPAMDAPKVGTPSSFVTYAHAHARVKGMWGPAGQYECIKCSGPARDWCYDGSDPEEILGVRDTSKRSPGLSWYSLYPEFYAPMCRSCHRQEDSARAKRELEEYRKAKYAERMSPKWDCVS